jgi:hypothetical protein
VYKLKVQPCEEYLPHSRAFGAGILIADSQGFGRAKLRHFLSICEKNGKTTTTNQLTLKSTVVMVSLTSFSVAR